jgi:hypothetical protein
MVQYRGRLIHVDTRAKKSVYCLTPLEGHFTTIIWVKVGMEVY